MRLPEVFIGVVFAAVGLAAGAASVTGWLLLSRHGECAPISVLKRKLPDLPDVRSPDAFSAYLTSKGLRFTRQVHQGAGGQAVEFRVPEAELAIAFVPEAQCKEVLRPPR